MLTKQHSGQKLSRKKCLSSTTRGRNQASRNDSSKIWNLLSISTGIGSDICDCQNFNLKEQYNHKKNQSKIPQEYQQQNKRFKKPSNFELLLTEKQNQQKLINNKNKNKIQQPKSQKSNIRKNKKRQIVNQTTVKQKHNFKKVDPKFLAKNVIKTIQQGKKKNILYFTPQEMIKKINPEKLQWIINEYIESQRFFTRTMPNTAFAKLFNKPCQQSYGYKNCSNESAQTNNAFKTFNVVPHTKQNNPKTYQSYLTSLQYAKRCKIDGDRQKYKLQLQLAKNIKFQELEKLIKKYEDTTKQENQFDQNNEDKEKNSKSQPKNKKKSYNMNEYLTEHPKVFELDESFNERYFEKVGQVSEYLINRNPILPEQTDIKSNKIDQIRQENHQTQKIEGTPSAHYLISCVQTPYNRNKYSFRQSRISSISERP